MTSLISGNHKSPRNLFFKTAVCQICQISLKFVFHQNSGVESASSGDEE